MDTKSKLSPQITPRPFAIYMSKCHALQKESCVDGPKVCVRLVYKIGIAKCFFTKYKVHDDIYAS